MDTERQDVKISRALLCEEKLRGLYSSHYYLPSYINAPLADLVPMDDMMVGLK